MDEANATIVNVSLKYEQVVGRASVIPVGCTVTYVHDWGKGEGDFTVHGKGEFCDLFVGKRIKVEVSL